MEFYEEIGGNFNQFDFPEYLDNFHENLSREDCEKLLKKGRKWRTRQISP
jgi:hypothetical protein